MSWSPDDGRKRINELRDMLEEVLEEGDSGRGPPLTASIDAAHALEGLDRADDALEAWDGWESPNRQRGRHLCESAGRPRDMTEDHDLDTTLTILEQNLQKIEDADNPGEKQTAISNYLSSVATLAAHSHRFAEEELGEEMDWLVQQKREELRELLGEVE